MIAAAQCIRPGCPSDTAGPELVEQHGVIVGMSYTCSVCGISWYEDMRHAA